MVEAVRESHPVWDDRILTKDPQKITRAPEAPSEDQATKNLNKVDHIVVLMLENRSFDHMLGYLTMRGQSEVEGLTGGADQVNRYDGRSYRPHRLRSTRFPKSQDPAHSINDVADQLETVNGVPNGGFVANFARVDPENPDLVMGFYSHEQLPVYDYLAHGFCLCDQWFSSIPGSTWPNRLYSMTGRADPDNEGVPDRPFWDYPSFPRHLDERGVSWRWYSHDPATLRMVDSSYRLQRENFRYYDRRAITTITKVGEFALVEGDSFLDDVRFGELPSVSWIDPNFIDLSFRERNSNDDHPPSDVRAGQSLVLETLRALVESERLDWDRVLLIVAYDEHGGFYDHVVPPAAPDDEPRFRRYGVRVPAFVVSPWVEPGTVSHRTFDHTSIIKTILQRFNPEAATKMTTRVTQADHLGWLLTRDVPARVPDYRQAIETIAAWQANRAGQATTASPVPSDKELAPPPPLHGFHADLVRATQQLRGEGLPPGTP